MLKIKNWSEFQHFKDRTPPWVKLYRTLLDDPNWHELTGECAKTLTMLWLLASEDKKQDGYLPDIKTISFRLRVSEQKIKLHISELNHWLVNDDINAISERYQDDIPETETEAYRKEKETNADFSDFWFLYPKKIAKQDAEKAYKKALKEIDHEALIGSLKKYVEANRGKDVGYIANAATWLNGKRWQDEQPSAPSSRTKMPSVAGG